MKVLLARVGYMKYYTGPRKGDEKPVGGGKYNEKYLGHEAYNFIDVDGTTYGFFQPNMKEPYAINLERIDPNCPAQKLDGVLVIWFAPHPEDKRPVVVGWYANATVYCMPQSGSHLIQRNGMGYNIVAKSKDCVLVPFANRDFRVGHGIPGEKKDQPGQSNAFYLFAKDLTPKKLNTTTTRWIPKLLTYVSDHQKTGSTSVLLAPKKAITFSHFCESLGCPLKNLRWSWAALSEDRRRAVFTVWEDHLSRGRYVLSTPLDSKTNGAREITKICKRVIEGDIEALGVLCVAQDIAADPRTRKSFDTSSLMVLRLVQEGEEIVAYFSGKAKVADALAHPVGVLPAIASTGAKAKARAAEDDFGIPPDGSVAPQPKLQSGYSYPRDDAVRNYVRKRAKGKCEYCDALGFLMPNGKRYLETHHILALSAAGPDTPGNVIALCSNDHSAAHYGSNREALEREMLAIVESKMKSHHSKS